MGSRGGYKYQYESSDGRFALQALGIRGVGPINEEAYQGWAARLRSVGRAGANAIGLPPVFAIWPKDIHNRVNEMHCKLRRFKWY